MSAVASAARSPEHFDSKMAGTSQHMSSFESRLFSETERPKVHIFEGEEPKEAAVYFAVCVVGGITVRDGPALWTSCGHRLVGACRDGFSGALLFGVVQLQCALTWLQLQCTQSLTWASLRAAGVSPL